MLVLEECRLRQTSYLPDRPPTTGHLLPMNTNVHTIRGACPHDCPDTCSLVTTVENGVALRVQGNPEHRHTDGALCTKVSRYTERTYHPERLLQPLKRVGPKGSGRFEPIGWDEALDDIAARLKDIAARDPQAILPYSYAGTMGLVQGEAMASRFFHKLGASFLDRTICATAGGEALAATLGTRLGTVAAFEMAGIGGISNARQHAHDDHDDQQLNQGEPSSVARVRAHGLILAAAFASAAV